MQVDSASGVFRTCFFAGLLSLVPWNRCETLSPCMEANKINTHTRLASLKDLPGILHFEIQYTNDRRKSSPWRPLFLTRSHLAGGILPLNDERHLSLRSPVSLTESVGAGMVDMKRAELQKYDGWRKIINLLSGLDGRSRKDSNLRRSLS
jgi:hypothetical protein